MCKRVKHDAQWLQWTAESISITFQPVSQSVCLSMCTAMSVNSVTLQYVSLPVCELDWSIDRVSRLPSPRIDSLHMSDFHASRASRLLSTRYSVSRATLWVSTANATSASRCLSPIRSTASYAHLLPVLKDISSVPLRRLLATSYPLPLDMWPQ